MRTSNTWLRIGVICGLALAGLAVADDLTLTGGDTRLTGSVRSINEAGEVELASELSPEPLFLKSDAVEKVVFSASPQAGEPPSTLVELANGDILPARIETLDERHLVVSSPDAGRLEIPRESIQSVQLGIQRRKVIYEGSNNLEEWTDAAGEMKNWGFENGRLISTGPASAYKKLPLSRQFILRFTLVWQAKQVAPNFQVYFADPGVKKAEPCDRYYLQFGGAGLEIKREAAKGKRFHTIAILNRPFDQYPDNRLQVELRVNRDAARMQLLLNGEPEGDFPDPIDNVPTGAGITLVCNTPAGRSQEIRDIEVLEFDDSRRRHRSEDRGDPDHDSLISREDDRWSGRLVEVRNTPKGAVFLFKTAFQEQPMEIPEAEVSTVFFATGKAKAEDKTPHPFVLRLAGEGSLRVASCQFDGDSASAVHPLLGPLKFRREGIVAMERNSPTPPKP